MYMEISQEVFLVYFIFMYKTKCYVLCHIFRNKMMDTHHWGPYY